jgi:hypothetical protein
MDRSFESLYPATGPWSTGYENARYYQQLATGSDGSVDRASGIWYSSPPPEVYATESKYKWRGQDIDLTVPEYRVLPNGIRVPKQQSCSINQSYVSLPMERTKFLVHPQGPASNNRVLYPKVRLPDGQYLYPQMERVEPLINGKRTMYDVSLEETNGIPGMGQVGYTQKLFPMTNEYQREVHRYANGVLPTPNW